LAEEDFDNVITIAFAAVDSQQQDNKERSEEMATSNKMTVMNLADWAKTDIDEIRERWAKRRIEIKEIGKKKAEREKKIEEAKKKKEKKRRRAIRERRCFVCRIFRHMARYCRNREEKKGLTQMPLNKFEVLRDRVMQREEGSGREIGKDRREILRKERKKKERKMKTKVQKKNLEKKEKKIEEEGKEEKAEKVEKTKEIEEEREVEMQGFSGGEILKRRYPLV